MVKNDLIDNFSMFLRHLHWFPIATITHYQNLVAYNITILLSYSSGSQKSEMGVTKLKCHQFLQEASGRLFPCLPSVQFISVQLLSSVQSSRSVMSDSLRPHELQHTRPPCPSPTPGVHPDSRPSSQ